MSHRRNHRRHHLVKRYARENPLSGGAKIGLAVAGVAIAGGIGYLVYQGMYTVAFNAADFTSQGGLSSATVGGNVSLARSTGQMIQGTATSVSADGQTMTVKITTGDGGSKYAAGVSITGVPVSYAGSFMS